MPPTAPVFRRLVAVVVALVMSAAACGGGGDGAANGEAAERTTTTEAGADGGTAGGDGRSDGDAGGDDPGTNVPGGLADTKTVPRSVRDLPPNSYGAPLPGRYEYEVKGANDPVVLDVFDTLGDQDEEGFDRTRDLDQLHIEYEGAEARASLFRWRAAGVRLHAEQRAQNTESGLNQGKTCNYEPDLLIQTKPLQVGAQWSDTSSCSTTQDDVTVTRERTMSSEVVAASTVTVGGRSVETLRMRRVIDTTTRADSTPPLLLTERRELTIEWIVGLGLAAQIDGTILDTVGGSAKPPRTFSWVLRSTTPAD